MDIKGMEWVGRIVENGDTMERREYGKGESQEDRSLKVENT